MVKLADTINVYVSLITIWIRARNLIYDTDPNRWAQFDPLYGESQRFIGEVFLITEDNQLAETINDFNEQYFKENWRSLNLEQTNSSIEQYKTTGLGLVSRMRDDVKDSTVLTYKDIKHIICSFLKK